MKSPPFVDCSFFLGIPVASVFQFPGLVVRGFMELELDFGNYIMQKALGRGKGAGRVCWMGPLVWSVGLCGHTLWSAGLADDPRKLGEGIGSQGQWRHGDAGEGQVGGAVMDDYL